MCEQAPWFANPRAVVPELTPSDCTATKPATNWNSSYFDDIMRDFMAAVVRRRHSLDGSGVLPRAKASMLHCSAGRML